MRAHNDWIIAHKVEPPRQTESGIFLPEKTLEKTENFVVVSIGPDVQTGGSLKEGDTVVYPKNKTPLEREVDGETVYFIKIDNILAVVAVD